MTRKDTILIAVVINAGLLAILFTTAVIYDTDKVMQSNDLSTSLVDNTPFQIEPPSTLIAEASSTGDEVDNVLKYYSSPASQPIVIGTQSEIFDPESIAIQSNSTDEGYLPIQDSNEHLQEHFVQVTVKRGDVLEKIAKSHKTSVGAIKRANHLQNENLSIGQVLKIPSKHEHSFVKNLSLKKEEKDDFKVESKKNQKKEEEIADATYHIIKSGDNPWKIAKQYDVKYEDILRLNQLDEEKARNLKIGERIRVK